MEKQVFFEKCVGNRVTEDMLQESSKLFSEHYGIWDEHAAQEVGEFAKAGSQVRLSKGRLRSDLLPNDATCSYARVTVNSRLAGNAFACRWAYGDKTVCWITQLVVHRDYRERGLATGLLNLLRHDDDDIYGIMSCHPAACMAAAKAFGSGFIGTVRLEFIRERAEMIMKASPIRYVRDAKLRGNLFNSEDASGPVSSADTGFWVDHTEPLEALAWARKKADWPLGELHDGHEFLLVVEARRLFRSPSRSVDLPKSH